MNFSPLSPLTPLGTTYPVYGIPGFYSASNDLGLTYHECIRRSRYYYENDSIAGTVIDRMTDIAVTQIKNRHKKYKQEIQNYYDGLAVILAPLLKQIPLDYLIDGMAIPEYRTDRIMGNRIHQDLGRTRYVIPKATWNRNAANIEIKKGPMGDRVLYLRIPIEDKELIKTKGKPDRIKEYEDLERLAPDYVRAIESGQTLFRLDSRPIFRKMTNYNTYPIPFLKRALGPLDYRQSLKRMDKVTTDRVIEALRQVKVGSDEYPADDDDITAAKNTLQGKTTQDTIMNVYTNHTISIEWIVPPVDALLDQTKYEEANADIFISMGFPRLWTVGENEKSNTADNKIASVGPIATLNALRSDVLEWIRYLYADLADKNGFVQYPDPYWTPINTAAVAELIQYADKFITNKTISRNTGALLYGTDWNTEREQIEVEQAAIQSAEQALMPDIPEVPETEGIPQNDNTNTEQGE